MRRSKKVNKVGQQFNTAHILYKRSTARFAGNLLWKDIFFVLVFSSDIFLDLDVFPTPVAVIKVIPTLDFIVL